VEVEGEAWPPRPNRVSVLAGLHRLPRLAVPHGSALSVPVDPSAVSDPSELSMSADRTDRGS
jgi:hypothetical protein